MTAAQVAAAPIALRPDVPVVVTWVQPGAPPPPETEALRGDELHGVRVTDEASRRRAEAAIIAALGKRHEGPADKYVNALFSRRLTRALLETSITPTQVTVVSALIGLTAAAVIAPGGWAAVALGGTLLELQSILDSVDGELARARYQFSRFGQWLDTLSDGVLDVAFGVGAGLAAGGGWATVAVVSAIARVFPEIYVYVDVYRKTGTPDQTRFRLWYQPDDLPAEEVFDRGSVVSWVRTLGRRETYVLLYFVLCLANLPEVVVVYTAAIAAFAAGGVAVHVVMKRLTRRQR